MTAKTKDIVLRLTINAEILAGTDIEQSASDLVSLASSLNAGVTADFNGVTLIAFPHTDPSGIVAYYHDMIGRKRNRPVEVMTIGR